MTDALTQTDILSPLNHSGSDLAGFNGYTMLCRDVVVPSTKGRIIQLRLNYPTPIQWRPKLFRAVTPRQGGVYRVIYNHPAMISYPGGGDNQWVDLICPVDLDASGPVYAGAYFNGASGGTSGANSLATGRAEALGDLGIGVFPLKDYSIDAREDGWETPALGARCQGEPTSPRYWTHFNVDGWMDGWGTTATSKTVANSMFTGSGWTSDDHNHDSSVGTLSLVLFKDGFEHSFPGNLLFPTSPVIRSDFSGGAHLTFRARCNPIDFSINNGKWRVWLQARHVDDPTKYANFMCNTIDNSAMLSDGQWHVFDQTLPIDPADWTYAAGHPDTYLPMDFAIALQNICNVHLPIVRPAGSAQPAGTIQVDYVGLAYQGGD